MKDKESRCSMTANFPLQQNARWTGEAAAAPRLDSHPSVQIEEIRRHGKLELVARSTSAVRRWARWTKMATDFQVANHEIEQRDWFGPDCTGVVRDGLDLDSLGWVWSSLVRTRLTGARLQALGLVCGLGWAARCWAGSHAGKRSCTHARHCGSHENVACTQDTRELHGSRSSCVWRTRVAQRRYGSSSESSLGAREEHKAGAERESLAPNLTPNLPATTTGVISLSAAKDTPPTATLPTQQLDIKTPESSAAKKSFSLATGASAPSNPTVAGVPQLESFGSLQMANRKDDKLSVNPSSKPTPHPKSIHLNGPNKFGPLPLPRPKSSPSLTNHFFGPANSHHNISLAQLTPPLDPSSCGPAQHTIQAQNAQLNQPNLQPDSNHPQAPSTARFLAITSQRHEDLPFAGDSTVKTTGKLQLAGAPARAGLEVNFEKGILGPRPILPSEHFVKMAPPAADDTEQDIHEDGVVVAAITSQTEPDGHLPCAGTGAGMATGKSQSAGNTSGATPEFLPTDDLESPQPQEPSPFWILRMLPAIVAAEASRRKTRGQGPAADDG
ncbi:cation/H+ exchanger 21 [Striga asiatica]|uniref:Cation/H+ exchanger 21 n=1 Tax=Striga asiatica TaxID=4170 RepID=A0A5A7PF66_STRAF|nr:cation/H+ exchanger 21 [Striga asiatica]